MSNTHISPVSLGLSDNDIIKRNFNQDQNGGLQNTFSICNSENCTNKVGGTNKLYVALVIIAVIVLIALIVLLVVCLVLRFKLILNQSEKSENSEDYKSFLTMQITKLIVWKIISKMKLCL